MRIRLSILCCILFFSCKKDYQAPIPDFTSWQKFADPNAAPIVGSSRAAMEGVYTLPQAAGFFGDLAALKWSFTNKGTDTAFRLSGFFGKDIAYFICEGKKLNGEILLNGYWRKMVGIETGIMRLTITGVNGADKLSAPTPVIQPGDILIEGVFGNGSEEPKNVIELKYDRKLNQLPGGFQIMAHRSGGRTSDLLPVSENSVEMILKTQEFGSTGIEIDVRFTSDGVPILYHDNTLNLRTIRKSGLIGPIQNYTYDQLSTFVRLVRGEKIPTLRQALDAVIYQTQLSFVWLDTKFDGSIETIRSIQKEYLAKAAAAGRTLQIVIGIPGTEQYYQFLALKDYAITPSLCELGIDEVERTNAKVWAPRFTEGTQNDKVDLMHSQGRKVFVWTLDVPEFITKFVNNGNFDGILSNYPSCVAFNYYVRQ